MLERFLGGLGPLDDERVKGGGKELVVAHVGSSHNQRKWPAIGLDQEASLHAVLAPVGGIRTDEVPPKRALPIAPSAACHSQFTPPNSSHSDSGKRLLFGWAFGHWDLLFARIAEDSNRSQGFEIVS